MFSFLRKETAAIQLYGKLPLAKDYLRIGGGDGAGRYLRDWLDHSFSGSAGRESPNLPYAMRFLIEVGSSPLMGCIWPSSDSGGLRSFPFSLFLDRRRKTMLADLESGLGHANSVWQRLDSIHKEHAGAADGQSYLEAMRAQNVELDQVEAGQAPPLDFGAWIEALFPGEGAAGLERVFAGLLRLLPSTPRGPVRLPIVADMPPLPQVVAWWRVAVEMGLFPEGRLPSVFFPHEIFRREEATYALFFPRPLQSSDVRWLSSSIDSSARGPGDFAAGRPISLSTGAAASEGVAPLWDSLHGALLGFMARHGS